MATTMNTGDDFQASAATSIGNHNEDMIIPTIEFSDVISCDLQQHGSDSVVYAEAQATNDSLRGFSLAETVVPVSDCSTDNHPNRRAEYISATVYKKDKGTPLGIGLKKSSGNRLRISSIKSGGLLERAPLRVDDTLISINNSDCRQMDERTAGELLRNRKGFLTLVVQNSGGDSCLVESMITKTQREEVAGIGLTGGSTFQAGIFPVITTIFPNGLFSSSLLNLGDRILAVNNISCEYSDSRTVGDIIKNSPDTVSILARTLSETAAVVAASSFPPTKRAKLLSATIHKPAGTPVGLGLRVTNKYYQPLVTISSINSTLQRDCPFRVGDILLSINGIKCGGGSPELASRLLRGLKGYCTIVASNPYGDDTLIEITMIKSSQHTGIGVSFKKDEDEKTTIISNVSKQGFFYQHVDSLKVGDQILYINGVPCDEIDLQTMANIIKNAPKLVKILARIC